MGAVFVAPDSLAGIISTGVSVALAYWGLRTLWKYQHRLDFRGYLLQFGAIAVGILLIWVGLVFHGGLALTIVFGVGVFLVWAFLLFPDIIYYSLRFWDRLKSRPDDACRDRPTL